MKLYKTYNIILNGIIYATSSNFNYISKLYTELKRTEPKAWIQTCYA